MHRCYQANNRFTACLWGVVFWTFAYDCQIGDMILLVHCLFIYCCQCLNFLFTITWTCGKTHRCSIQSVHRQSGGEGEQINCIFYTFSVLGRLKWANRERGGSESLFRLASCLRSDLIKIEQILGNTLRETGMMCSGGRGLVTASLWHHKVIEALTAGFWTEAVCYLYTIDCEANKGYYSQWYLWLWSSYRCWALLLLKDWTDLIPPQIEWHRSKWINVISVSGSCLMQNRIMLRTGCYLDQFLCPHCEWRGVREGGIGPLVRI